MHEMDYNKGINIDLERMLTDIEQKHLKLVRLKKWVALTSYSKADSKHVSLLVQTSDSSKVPPIVDPIKALVASTSDSNDNPRRNG